MDFAEFLESIVRISFLRSRAGALGEAAGMDECVRRLMEEHRFVARASVGWMLVAGGSPARACVVSHGCGSILGLSKFLRESSFKCEVEVGVNTHNQETHPCMTLYLQVGDTSKVMNQNMDALRTVFYYYATLDEVRHPIASSVELLVTRASR